MDARDDESHRPPRSSLFHSVQSLRCLLSAPAFLVISLCPVPSLSPLGSRAPRYFTLSSPFVVSSRLPRSSLFHSVQSLLVSSRLPRSSLFHSVKSLRCLLSAPTFLVISLCPVPSLSPLGSHVPRYFTLSSPFVVSSRFPRSSLFHSVQSLRCLLSAPTFLVISLCPVPSLSPLGSRVPRYFTLSSPFVVSSRLPRSSLLHSLQSLRCLLSAPALLVISLSPVPSLSPLGSRVPRYFTLSSPFLSPLGSRVPRYFTLSSPFVVSSRLPRSSLFHSVQSLRCLLSAPTFLVISLCPVPSLSPLGSHVPRYFTLSSPFVVSSRLPRSSLFHSVQSLRCLLSAPAFLVISLCQVPSLSPLGSHVPRYCTLSSPFVVSSQLPRSSLFHSLQSLRCLLSAPTFLLISLCPVPYLSPLCSSVPRYFTLSSPLFVSA